MPCLCIYCKRSKPRDPDSQKGHILCYPFRFFNFKRNPESSATSSGTSEAHLNLLAASGSEIKPNPESSATSSGTSEAHLNLLAASGSKIIPEDPSLPLIYYNPNNSHYDMRGAKYGYIICNENFKNSDFTPSRIGTRDDAVLLAETLNINGFQTKICYDMEYKQIFDLLSKVSQQGHKRTSCLWVTIMTQATNNALLAADRPYKLSQIEALLQSKNLAGKPKILTLPCIRGGNEEPGDNTRLTSQPLQNGSATWSRPIVGLWYGIIDCVFKLYNQVFNQEYICSVCEAQNKDNGNIVVLEDGSTIVQPSTADFLYIQAANNALSSFSILNRAICETLQEKQGLEYGDLILNINQKVDRIEENIPETRITLTQTLRLPLRKPTTTNN